MAQKRIQVFISSTFWDLEDERQAAVEAILRAGHVPAGMELFAAGSETQLATIHRWIESSDAFMVIVGTRYGSVEPKSGKSYVELEYDHAEACGKELFGLVLDDAWVARKHRELEAKAVDDTVKAQQFRTRVLSKIANTCANLDAIKYHTMAALAEIVAKETVRGWISSGDATKLEMEIERLKTELAAARMSPKVPSSGVAETEQRFHALCDVLRNEKTELPGKPNVLDAVLIHMSQLTFGISSADEKARPIVAALCPRLLIFGLLDERPAGYGQLYTLNEKGRALVAVLLAEKAGKKIGD